MDDLTDIPTIYQSKYMKFISEQVHDTIQLLQIWLKCRPIIASFDIIYPVPLCLATMILSIKAMYAVISNCSSPHLYTQTSNDS